MNTPLKKELEIREINPQDREWITQLLTEHWGSKVVISREQMHDATKLPGFIVLHKKSPVGLVTYHLEGEACEVVTLDSWQENIGVGTILIEAVKKVARKAGCSRLWLITTNDNLHALGFYQKRGFHLVAVHANALAESRKIKPSIPEIGMQGIPLRDEIELEVQLS
jgi:N-acetylglutamate synthase-like GNAT family acetyltransferase